MIPSGVARWWQKKQMLPPFFSVIFAVSIEISTTLSSLDWNLYYTQHSRSPALLASSMCNQ